MLTTSISDCLDYPSCQLTKPLLWDTYDDTKALLRNRFFLFPPYNILHLSYTIYINFPPAATKYKCISRAFFSEMAGKSDGSRPPQLSEMAGKSDSNRPLPLSKMAGKSGGPGLIRFRSWQEKKTVPGHLHSRRWQEKVTVPGLLCSR